MQSSLCLAVAVLSPLLWVPVSAELPHRFDYVIIGGGTSGLAVANRLSEIPRVTVAVIEAGTRQNHNPRVTAWNSFLQALDTPVDWSYESVNQTSISGRQIEYHAGKGLGGTSLINGMTYVRAEDVQIDAWGKIGNDGWSWNDLFPYYLKSEKFRPPTTAQIGGGASYVPQYHGEQGYLDVGFPYELLNASFPHTVNSTWENLSIPFNPDVNGGHVRGFTVWPSTFNEVANRREDSAQAYYYPIQKRSNLYIFENTTVNKILWQDSRQEIAIASGVEIVATNGNISTIYADTEVIVSAGSLRTPAILELSGVGNPAILSEYGITTKIALPAVGENLQDQINVLLAYTGSENDTGTTPYVAYADMSDFFYNTTASLSASSLADLKNMASIVAEANNNVVNATALEYLFGIQHDLIFNQGVPNAEIITEISATTLVGVYWPLLPFSRGSVHITSADPRVNPAIDPKFLLLDFDTEVAVAIGKLVRKFWSTAPMSDQVTAEIVPGLAVLPANATDAQWASYIKAHLTSNSHPLGTAAMMPRELGGVVDDRLRVYGTQNVRVVDASAMPMQVSGHLTSTLYAMAEKAADLIKEDMHWTD